jgi:hypothetical protein
MYADMYNREYDGGSSESEKTQVAGVPIDSLIGKGEDDNHTQDSDSEFDQHGGKKICGGPFTNKVVPAGLVMIHIRKDPDVEYADTMPHSYIPRKTVPESLFDVLIGSLLKERKYSHRITPVKRRKIKDRSRKHRKST